MENRVDVSEAKECVNTLIIFCKQNDWFQKFEGSLLSMEGELNKGESNEQTITL